MGGNGDGAAALCGAEVLPVEVGSEGMSATPAQRYAARVPAERDAYPPPAVSEPYWPAPLTVVLAIGLQLLLPGVVTAGPKWLVPGVEGVLLIGVTLATPGDPLRIPH